MGPGRSASPASAACWRWKTAGAPRRCLRPASQARSHVVRSVGVPAEAPAARHGGQSLAPALLCTVLFLTFLDNTVVSVALGEVYGDLHASPTQLQWVVRA